MIKICSLKVTVYRFPLDNPVQTSFGLMVDRPMTIVELVSSDGHTGWGEIWCNFPHVGAEHRARLISSVFEPLVLNQVFASPKAAFEFLTKATWVLGLQTGEFGPIAQCIAGIDIALSDIYAKQRNKPLWELFGGQSDVVALYASGISPKGAEQTARLAVDNGYDALKLKIGFGSEVDIRNIKALREVVGSAGTLMVDANQAWTVDDACEMIKELTPFDLSWLEEPIAKDRPHSEWKRLRDEASVPLAGGENLLGKTEFSDAIKDGILSVIQPDLAKWGGLSQTIPLAKSILNSGRRYCPHYLGGGIGLVASAHALAAAGGDGMLEVDFNPNPLRSELVGDLLSAKNGKATLGKRAGLGFTPNMRAIKKYEVAQHRS